MPGWTPSIICIKLPAPRFTSQDILSQVFKLIQKLTPFIKIIFNQLTGEEHKIMLPLMTVYIADNIDAQNNMGDD